MGPVAAFASVAFDSSSVAAAVDALSVVFNLKIVALFFFSKKYLLTIVIREKWGKNSVQRRTMLFEASSFCSLRGDASKESETTKRETIPKSNIVI